MAYPPVPGTYALLADGSTVEIRHAQSADFGAVRDMHANLSPTNAYFRFFNFSPRAPQREAERVLRRNGSFFLWRATYRRSARRDYLNRRGGVRRSDAKLVQNIEPAARS